MATLLYSTGPLLSPTPHRPMRPRPDSRFAPPTPPHDPALSFSPILRPPPSPALPTTASTILMGRVDYSTFLATQSRVIRIFNLPKDPAPLLASFFPPHTAPLTFWVLRHEYGGPPPGEEDSVWAVFQSHSQAAAALGLSGATVSIATALEADLEPFQKLRKFELRRHSLPSRCAPSPTSSPTAPHSLSRLIIPPRHSNSASDQRDRPLDFGGNPPDYSYTLSTNPPNPRNNFRQGDWICTNPSCSAHNFMRNVVCFGCGNPRPSHLPGHSPTTPLSALTWPRGASSPRFVQPPEFINDAASSHSILKKQSQPCLRSFSPNAPFSSPAHMGAAPFAPATQTTSLSQPSSATSPSALTAAAAAVALKLPSLLTPSGRSFSQGGKVQNISSDPFAPCIMYWPDNEPRPSQRQIRPPGPGHAAPILNTGNKGPIEQQPGDWVCGVCDYLNWRRRKVCQTCYPYAEGNTDGVSAAVQAERIAMLAQLLSAHPQTQAQTQARPQAQAPPPPPPPHSIASPIPPSTTSTSPHPHSHTIPTPPSDSGQLPSLRQNVTMRAPHPSPPLTPEFVPCSLSFLHDEEDEGEGSVGKCSASPSPQGAVPPHMPGPLGASIWALRRDEV